jgi:phage-related protein
LCCSKHQTAYRQSLWYDLEKDISESNDLAAQNPEKTSELKLKYEEWRAEMKSTMGDLKKNKQTNTEIRKKIK